MELLAVSAAMLATAHAMDAAAWKQRSIYQVLTDRFALKPGDRDTCDDPGCEPPNGYVRHVQLLPCQLAGSQPASSQPDWAHSWFLCCDWS